MKSPIFSTLVVGLILGLAACGGGSSKKNNDAERSEELSDAGIDLINSILSDLDSDPSQTSDRLQRSMEKFEESLELDPNNDTARLFLAATMIPAFVDQPETAGLPALGPCSTTLCSLLDGFGFGEENRSLSALLSGESPTTPDGFTASSPTLGEVQDWLADEFSLQLMDEAAGLLEAISPSYRETIDIDGVAYEFDYGDAMMMAATLRIYQSVTLAFLAINFDMRLDSANTGFTTTVDGNLYTAPYRLYSDGESWTTDGWVFDTSLAYNHELGVTRPDFINTTATGAEHFLDTVKGTRSNTDRLQISRDRLITAIQNYENGADALLNETNNQRANGFLSIESDNACTVEGIIDWMDPIPAALIGSVSVDIPPVTDQACELELPGFTIHPGAFLSSTYQGRPFFPDYDLGSTPGFGTDHLATPASFSDPTLGGVFTTMTGEHMVELWQSLNVGFEEMMNGLADLPQNESAVIGNWQYADTSEDPDLNIWE
ncbi:MAG: hypothetical protein H8E15_08020 [Planctomycetes bacterium]|nr:hypothetical protein [Planctomycetota bacterium]